MSNQFNTPPATVGLPPFAVKIIAKLRRFEECASDGQGADIGGHWFTILERLGLLMRVQHSPALWEISQQGEDLIGIPAPLPLEGIAAMALSEDVREALQDLINGATQGEGDEYDFADEVGTLLDPIYSRENVSRLLDERNSLKAQLKRALDDSHRNRGYFADQVEKCDAHKVRIAELESAVKANHEWHREYDDHGGYPGSELFQINRAVLPESVSPEPDPACEKCHGSGRIPVGGSGKAFGITNRCFACLPLREHEGIPGTSFQRMNQLANEGE